MNQTSQMVHTKAVSGKENMSLLYVNSLNKTNKSRW